MPSLFCRTTLVSFVAKHVQSFSGIEFVLWDNFLQRAEDFNLELWTLWRQKSLDFVGIVLGFQITLLGISRYECIQVPIGSKDPNLKSQFNPGCV